MMSFLRSFGKLVVHVLQRFRTYGAGCVRHQVRENSPVIYHWVIMQQNQSSPARDERIILPSLTGLFISW